jgi:deoxyribodipyrimidine photo-lyase
LPPSPIIVWLRRDLRLSDNPALYQASQHDRPVVPVYVLDDNDPKPLGAAAGWWLHHSLKALCRDLATLGTRLVLRRGNPAEVLGRLAEETGARAVFWNRRYDPAEMAIDAGVARGLAANGIEVGEFGAPLLFEPKDVQSRAGQAFQMFAPFWRHCQSLGDPPPPLPRPVRLIRHGELVGDEVADWHLLGRRSAWSSCICSVWTPGEDAARARLADFLAGTLDRYAATRDHLDQEGTSRLSPHLAFGEISPRQIWHAARALGAQADESYLRELGWREFCYHTLNQYPELPDQPQRGEFRAFPWTGSETQWNAFAAGRTGYPIVDAGMRMLWEIGWLHNRVRMIVASFLVKDLLIPWQRGEKWFADTLVDADTACNAYNWQWVSGCAVESAPYFRIFNPVIQGEKFDPRGRFVRRWVPEVGNLPDLYIHRPWQAPPEVLAKAGVTIGRTYPFPIVEHDAARRRALLAYEQMRRAA